jgi:7-carboxy-7-deazaguanine synthase
MKLFPIIEIFGPTFQGEGSMAGQQTHFVRFGGCDYRCSWCDTMYAVDPDQVKQNARQMTAAAIVQNIEGLSGHPKWITFSGGNPLLFDFLEIVALLHQKGFYVAAETQGSKFVSRPAVSALDLLILSPKPPSSGMSTDLEGLRFC